jgi:hypothetical protein
MLSHPDLRATVQFDRLTDLTTAHKEAENG